MKKCAVILGICSLSLAAPVLGNPPIQPIVGRTIYHTDDSRTESVRDPNRREMTEMTYSAAGQLTVRKVFLLNEKGEPMQGNVYDGRGNLVARCQSFYDEFGRRKEDRLTNLNGQVFQQVIHEYDKDGKALTPKVINLNVQSPSIKPEALDFTQTSPVVSPGTPGRFAPQNATSGSAPAQPAPTSGEEKPKSNFFKRLFKKKD